MTLQVPPCHLRLDRVSPHQEEECLRSEVVRFAGEKFSAAHLADELALSCRHLPAHGYDMRSPFDFETFERVVIEVHLMRRGRNFSAVIRIINHQVGVAPELDRPFAREEAEDFCGLRARGFDELMEIDPTALHPVGVIKIDPILE